jgi:hypothetical protein
MPIVTEPQPQNRNLWWWVCPLVAISALLLIVLLTPPIYRVSFTLGGRPAVFAILKGVTPRASWPRHGFDHFRSPQSVPGVGAWEGWSLRIGDSTCMVMRH